MLTLEELGIQYEEMSSYTNVVTDIAKILAHSTSKPRHHNWEAYWKTFSSPRQPTYLNRSNVFRYNGKYIVAPEDTEAKFFAALKDRCFKKYLTDVTAIAEFGIGSGGNLIQLNQMWPDKILYGYDWSEAAVKLTNNISNNLVFDMSRPTPLLMNKPLGVFTCGALEQLGDNYPQFLSFLPTLDAAIYFHIEPFIELYDEKSLFDALAIAYHKKRDYLGRYLTDLKSRFKIVDCIRTGFGNYLNEGYMVVAWTLN